MPGPGFYDYENLVVSGTHTHSSPAGFLQYTLFQVTSWGFVNQTFEAYVAGVAEAVAKAHADVAAGRNVTLASGQLEKNSANINRSPTSCES
jgi:neutral ceramidase